MLGQLRRALDMRDLVDAAGAYGVVNGSNLAPSARRERSSAMPPAWCMRQGRMLHQ